MNNKKQSPIQPGNDVEWIGETVECCGLPLIRKGDCRKVIGINENNCWLSGRDNKGLFGACEMKHLKKI